MLGSTRNLRQSLRRAVDAKAQARKWSSRNDNWQPIRATCNNRLKSPRGMRYVENLFGQQNTPRIPVGALPPGAAQLWDRIEGSFDVADSSKTGVAIFDRLREGRNSQC